VSLALARFTLVEVTKTLLLLRADVQIPGEGTGVGAGSLSLSQPVWGCTEGPTLPGGARPLVVGDDAVVLAGTGEVLGRGRRLYI